MTLEMIGTQSIHPDYSNLHNIDYVPTPRELLWSILLWFLTIVYIDLKKPLRILCNAKLAIIERSKNGLYLDQIY